MDVCGISGWIDVHGAATDAAAVEKETDRLENGPRTITILAKTKRKITIYI